MDIKLKKKHPLLKYKYYIGTGLVLTGLLVYLLISVSGPQRVRIDSDRVDIVEVRRDQFMEYLDVEGLVQPRLTLRINAEEGGTVARVVAEAGQTVRQGDTILVLSNPDLLRTVEDERDRLSRLQTVNQREQIAQERRTLELSRGRMETNHRLEQLTREYNLVREEHQLGITSAAQFELASINYNFNRRNAEIQREQQLHDSLSHAIELELSARDLQTEVLRVQRIADRLDNLVVRAPIDGQLSHIGPSMGERVSAGAQVGTVNVVDEVMLTTRISEFHIGRITVGLPASITYRGERFPLRISRVNPEIRDRQFEIDLVFTDNVIEDIRIGRSYRIQIELDQPQEALVMPIGNFFQHTGGQWVFRVNEAGDRAVRVPISIGRQNPRQYEILDGLQAGDRVIVTGYDNFGDAMEIILR